MTSALPFTHLPETQGRRRRSKQADLGQFFTPVGIADFMAGIFNPPQASVHLLDAGAGEGSLTSAFTSKWKGEHSISADLFEIDDDVIPKLENLVAKLRASGVDANLHHTDFLETASELIRAAAAKPYTHAILNPPYRKIATQSRERFLAASVGLETVNLYSAFVGLALDVLRPAGEMVAIIPRSFCNGPYYRPFRSWLFARSALKRIHLFHSRRDAFADADVLQENVIIHLAKGEPQQEVIVSFSSDASFNDLQANALPFSAIVKPDDASQVIHIPLSDEDRSAGTFDAALSSMNVDVATGPVVSFRLRQHLRNEMTETAVPLLYPQHLKNGRVVWPIEGKKPNAIELNASTHKWMFQRGWYVLVKRFSSKEERRRVVAALCDPNALPGVAIGIENKVNVLHSQRGSLDESLARGLTIFLNSTQLDNAFRVFSGHTQVNATDLRGLNFPSEAQLARLGKKWTGDQGLPEQSVIDRWLEELLNAVGEEQ